MSYYTDIQNSLIAFCKSKAEQYIADGHSTDIKQIKFDTYGNPSLLPETDLIGPFMTQITDEGKLVYVETMILVSTIQDTNLFRMDEMVDDLYESLRPEKYIPLLNSETGAEIGQFFVSGGTSIMPVEQTAGRPMKAIALSLMLDLQPSEVLLGPQ